MERRTFMAMVSRGLFPAPLVSQAQQVGKIARVGHLGSGPVQSQEQMATLVAAMKEVGWVQGRNLVIEWRSGESADQLHAAAAELAWLKINAGPKRSSKVATVPGCKV